MKTVQEAATQALKDLGRPAHVSEILAQIQKAGYYTFKAKDARSVLGMELSRNSGSRRAEISRTPKEACFTRVAPGTYWLADGNPVE